MSRRGKSNSEHCKSNDGRAKKLGKITKINHPERRTRQPLLRSRIPLPTRGRYKLDDASNERNGEGRESAREKEGRRAGGRGQGEIRKWRNGDGH